MLHTITRREYTVTCDGCGYTGSTADSAKEASRIVHDLGWRAVTPLPYLEFLTTWLCPYCQEHRESAASAK